MQSLQDKVRERIQTQFAELIPDEMFAALVKQAVAAWTDKELPKLIHQELESKAREVVRSEFCKAEWQETWTNAGMGMSPAMAEAMKAAAPDLVANMFGRMAQEFVQTLRYQR